MYGGQPPTTQLPSYFPQEISSNLPPSNIIPKDDKPKEIFVNNNVNKYPIDGTWKEKIIYALTELKKPSMVKDIVNLIAHAEKAEDISQVHKTVSQYTSTLGKDGIINVDNSSYRHTYSLKD